MVQTKPKNWRAHTVLISTYQRSEVNVVNICLGVLDHSKPTISQEICLVFQPWKYALEARSAKITIVSQRRTTNRLMFRKQARNRNAKKARDIERIKNKLCTCGDYENV